MTPEISEKFMEKQKQEANDAYRKLGLSKKKYREEVVTGALLPWRYFGPKAKCLEWYREETGIKPIERTETKHDISGSLMAAVAAYLSGEQKK